MAKSRRRAEEHEEHVNHERWLVSYADMMTLLMVLFIVMFAISQVDQRKFDQLRDGMAAGFGATASPFEGSESTMVGDGAEPMEKVAPDVSAPEPENIDVQTSSATRAAAAAEQAKDVKGAESELDHLKEIEKQIAAVLKKHGKLQDVSMKIDERGLSVSLVSRHIVFAPNRAGLTPRGKQVVDVLAPVFRDLPNKIEVDGHTNQVKVKPKYYPTDWELSAARAVNVLRYVNGEGVPANRLTAVAYGHQRPLRDPSLPGAEALNKRVDLIVLRSAREVLQLLAKETIMAKKKATEGDEEATGGGGRMKLILVVVVLLAVAGGAYFFLLAPKSEAKPKPEPGVILKLDPIQVNLAGDHYLKLGLALQASKKAPAELDGSKALDIAIDEFSGLNMDDLARKAYRHKLQKELNRRLGKAYEEEVIGSYFTDFVTQ